MAMLEPDWLTWSRELQAIAQTGLAFVSNTYDRERYEMLRILASKIMAAHTASPVERIDALFAGEGGYPTPKVDVRGAAFDEQGRVLLVREVADVLVEPDGKIPAVMVSVGGFLGIGKKLVAVPYDSLHIDEKDGKVAKGELPGASSDQLKELAEFTYPK